MQIVRNMLPEAATDNCQRWASGPPLEEETGSLLSGIDLCSITEPARCSQHSVGRYTKLQVGRVSLCGYQTFGLSEGMTFTDTSVHRVSIRRQGNPENRAFWG